MKNKSIQQVNEKNYYKELKLLLRAMESEFRMTDRDCGVGMKFKIQPV